MFQTRPRPRHGPDAQTQAAEAEQAEGESCSHSHGGHGECGLGHDLGGFSVAFFPELVLQLILLSLEVCFAAKLIPTTPPDPDDASWLNFQGELWRRVCFKLRTPWGIAGFGGLFFFLWFPVA